MNQLIHTFKPQEDLKRDPMVNIYYRTQKLKLLGLEILRQNNRKLAIQLVEAIQDFVFQTKKAPHNPYKIVNFEPLSLKVELQALDIQKKNSIVSLSALWKLYNFTPMEVSCAN